MTRAAYVRGAGRVVDVMGEMIAAAEQSIVLQMYLFAANGQLGVVQPRADVEPHANLVADWLIAKRRAHPGMPIVVVLDSNTPDDPTRVVQPQTLIVQRLRQAGIAVVTANLFYNRFDRERTFPPACAFHRDGTDTPAERWVTAQQKWQTLHNVEDHRKNLVIDGGAWALVTSHNLIDIAFDWHENAFVFDGAPAREVWRQAQVSIERALELPQRIDDRQRESLLALGDEPRATSFTVPGLADAKVDVLANTEIRERFEAVIEAANPGDELDLATAYFSDRPTWEALVTAAARGVRVRVLIDDLAALPLPVVHGTVIRGLANRNVVDLARTTRAPNLAFRVHHSSAGAMMHLKTLIARGRAPLVIGGQCNATPNSFSGAWTETDVEVRGAAMVAAATAHFDSLWRSRNSKPLAPPGRWYRPQRWAAAAALAAFAAVGLSP